MRRWSADARDKTGEHLTCPTALCRVAEIRTAEAEKGLLFPRKGVFGCEERVSARGESNPKKMRLVSHNHMMHG